MKGDLVKAKQNQCVNLVEFTTGKEGYGYEIRNAGGQLMALYDSNFEPLYEAQSNQLSESNKYEWVKFTELLKCHAGEADQVRESMEEVQRTDFHIDDAIREVGEDVVVFLLAQHLRHLAFKAREDEDLADEYTGFAEQLTKLAREIERRV